MKEKARRSSHVVQTPLTHVWVKVPPPPEEKAKPEAELLPPPVCCCCGAGAGAGAGVGAGAGTAGQEMAAEVVREEVHWTSMGEGSTSACTAGGLWGGLPLTLRV
jgi:hypothetical protein